MREKYESIALGDLKEIAKSRGIKGISTMKKSAVVEAMLKADQIEAEKAEAEKAETEKKELPKEQTEKKEAQKSEVQKRTQKAARTENASQTETSSQIKTVSQPETVSQAQAAPQTEAIPQETVAGTVRQPDRGISLESNKVDYNKREQPKTEYNRTQNNRIQNNRTDGDRSDPNRMDYVRGKREPKQDEEKLFAELDSGVAAKGILEILPDGYGFIRCENYLPGENDVYVAPSQIRRFNLKTGDIVEGNTRIRTQTEKFSALLYLKKINGYAPDVAAKRVNFEDLIPIFPNERIRLETPGATVAMRIMDLMSPVGKGQRGMIVSPPKAGKTTLLKEVAKSFKKNNPEMHLIILLIDERPEEVTDIREAIEGPDVEVIYSTFDELPDHHKRVAEMVIERAKRLVEHGRDVAILLDSITRLTRAYNLTVPPSGRTLSGGLDPAALHMPKRFFGAARNMRNGGSLTILATALVETGSKMDDVVYEEFKGTGNMEMVLDRKLSERRVFPAIDIPKSGTRREDLLLTPEELEAINIMRKALNGMKTEEAVDRILDMFAKTRNNAEFVQMVKKIKFI